MKKNKKQNKSNEIQLKGIPVSKGYASGASFIIKKNYFNLDSNGAASKPKDEIERFKQAVFQYEQEFERQIQNIKKENPLAGEILQSLKLILADPEIHNSVLNFINQGYSAEYAVEQTYKNFEKNLLTVKSQVVRERAFELEQIKNRFLEILVNNKLSITIPKNSIVVATSVSADQVISFHENNISGLITEAGGTTTHSAIIARSLKIPSVIGVANATSLIQNGDLVLIDGFKGIIFVNPEQDTQEAFQKAVKEKNLYEKQLGELIYKPTQTLDGKRIELQANLNFIEELDETELYHSDGIGLVRTEHLVPIKDYYENSISISEFEEQQFEIYREVAVKLYPKIVTFRAFDLGGDKFPSLFGLNEANPMLGFRGIRYLLSKPNFFKAQLRAFLKASAEKNVQIMLPMITTVEEVLESRMLLNQCMKELSSEGFEFDPEIKFGIMIETPAAALQTSLLAKYVDFFSIGTNDLTQYTLVADRDNSQVSSYFSPFHPSVLRLMKITIESAKRRKRKVGICGELASHPAAAGLLVALDFDSISISIENLLQVKKWISEIDSRLAKKNLLKILKFSTAEEVRKFLEID